MYILLEAAVTAWQNCNHHLLPGCDRVLDTRTKKEPHKRRACEHILFNPVLSLGNIKVVLSPPSAVTFAKLSSCYWWLR